MATAEWIGRRAQHRLRAIVTAAIKKAGSVDYRALTGQLRSVVVTFESNSDEPVVRITSHLRLSEHRARNGQEPSFAEMKLIARMLQF